MFSTLSMLQCYQLPPSCQRYKRGRLRRARPARSRFRCLACEDAVCLGEGHGDSQFTRARAAILTQMNQAVLPNGKMLSIPSFISRVL